MDSSSADPCWYSPPKDDITGSFVRSFDGSSCLTTETDVCPVLWVESWGIVSSTCLAKYAFGTGLFNEKETEYKSLLTLLFTSTWLYSTHYKTAVWQAGPSHDCLYIPLQIWTKSFGATIKIKSYFRRTFAWLYYFCMIRHSRNLYFFFRVTMVSQ